MHNTRGVSLAELLVTIGILSVVFLAGVGSFSYITKSIQISKSRTLATNLCQEQVEKLKNLSYYRLLVTTNTYSDNRFSPPLAYDTGNYPPQTIIQGGITFIRGTRVDFAYQSGASITTTTWTSNDTALKQITTYVMWNFDGTWKHLEIRNLMANPAADPLTATFTGIVQSTMSVPIAGALVQVLDHSEWFDSTDASGVYQFSVSQGSYTVMASSTGWFSATAPGTQSINSGQTQTLNFSLGRKSKGTLQGSVYLRTGPVISQILGSSVTASGFRQQYVELFNPTTGYIVMVMGMNARLIALKYQQQGDAAPTDIQTDFAVMSSSIPPQSYYLIANAPIITVGGVTRTADAVFRAATPNFPNVISIASDPGNDAAGVGLVRTMTNEWIDRLGWTKVASSPPLYEGSPFPQPATGLEDGEQFIRRASTAGVSASVGAAYDSNNNAVDFWSPGAGTIAIPPRNSSVTGVSVIAGVPTDGAFVSVNDGLSSQVTASLTGSPPYAWFSVPDVATGTWSMVIASGTYFQQIDNIAVNGGTLSVPNGATSPSGSGATLLQGTTEYGFVSGTVRTSAGVPLAGIIVSAQGNSVTTTAQGTYFLVVPVGTIQVTANANNYNKAYESDSLYVTLNVGQLASGQDFSLSLAGILRGYFQTSSMTPMPNRVAVALQSGSEVAQASSDQSGYFYLANLPVGTYTIQPALDPLEATNPASVTVTLASTGTATAVSTFTLTSALGQITGQALNGTNPIDTGVLVLASTATLPGGAAAPPPSLDGSAGTACNPCYYAGSSNAQGQYELDVRSIASPYYLYGWYSRVYDNGVSTTTRKGPFSVSVSTPGVIMTQNMTW